MERNEDHNDEGQRDIRRWRSGMAGLPQPAGERVDPLDLALIIDAVALDAIARAQQGVHTVRQPQFSVDRRGLQPVEHWEQHVGVNDVRANVQLHDVQHV